MKADKLTIGQKIKYGFYGNDSTNLFWTVLSVDLQDRRFVYIKSDKNGKMKRVLVNRIQPIR